jgi:GntR family transcriptional regulator
MAKRNKLPPYQAIAADLRAKIESGELAPGEQVPSVPEICELYKVSRGTALRAMGVLRDEGLTEVSPGWGTFVKER